jgi:hypothetical protein
MRALLGVVCLFGVATLLLSPMHSNGADDAKGEKPAPKNDLETVIYYVGDLIERARWRKSIGGDAPEGMEGIAHVIMANIDPESWAGKDANATLSEIHGEKLEIQATPEQHKRIGEFLKVLRRLTDVTVVVESELYEVDRGLEKKEIKPALGKGNMAVIDEAVVEKVRKDGKLVLSNKATVIDGQTTAIFSKRTATAYLARPGAEMPYKAVFHGFACGATTNVSSDYRFVSIKLTRTVTELLEIKKQTVVMPESEKEAELEVPMIQESVVTETVKVGDGVHAVVTIPYRPATLDKDKVLILLVLPQIRIEEEERERGKDDKTKIG